MAVSRVYDDSISSGKTAVSVIKSSSNAVKSSNALSLFDQDITVAIKKMKQLKDRLLSVERYIETLTADTNREKDQILRSQRSYQSQLEDNKQKKIYAKRELEGAESELDCAQRRMTRSRRERNEAQDKLDGIKYGFWFPPYALFWVGREIVQNNSGRVDRANDEIRSCEQRISRYRSQISFLQTEIARCEAGITNMQQKLIYYENELKKSCDTVRELKNLIAMLMEAQDYCNEIITKSYNAYHYETTLRACISKISSKPKEWNFFFGLHATKRQVCDFEDAISLIEDLLNNDRSKFSFGFDFTCFECGQNFSSLPWVSSTNKIYCDYCM